MDSNSPIGVFDSGLGGLTVLKELRRLLPHENFIFVGDSSLPHMVHALLKKSFLFYNNLWIISNLVA